MRPGPGVTIGGFRIKKLIARGGMGEVYLVQHPRLPRQDALKILPAEMSADPEFRARFNREAEMAAALYHPHIVGIHDRGEFHGQLWISMDFIDGPDAGRLLRDQYPNGMPPGEVVDIVAAVAGATRQVMRDEKLLADLRSMSIDPVGDADPVKSAAYFTKEMERWAPIIKATGAKME